MQAETGAMCTQAYTTCVDRMKVGRERLNKRIKAFKPKIPENFTSDLTLGELKKDLPFQVPCLTQVPTHAPSQLHSSPT